MRIMRSMAMALFFFITTYASAQNTGRASVKMEKALSTIYEGFGVRDKLQDRGVRFSGTYTADILGNPIGGRNQDFAYAHSLYLYMDVDLEKLAGWHGGSLQVAMFEGAGSNLSNTIGNFFNAAEAYIGSGIMLYDLWLRQEFLGGKIAIKAGHMSAGDDFLFLPIYADYVNGVINSNPDSVGFSAPITFAPFNTWGMNVSINPTDDWTLLLGAYQVTPALGSINTPGMGFGIQPDNGVAAIAEVAWTPTFGKKVSHPASAKEVVTTDDDGSKTGLPGIYKAGLYYTYGTYTSPIAGSAIYNTAGGYFMAQQMVWREKPGSNQGLTPWCTFTFTPQQNISLMPFFAGGGFEYKGLIPSRDEDKTLFATYYGLLSDQYPASETSSGGYELVFEWGYRVQINQNIYLQPDVQWIIPSTNQGYQNALVLGAEIGVAF